MFAQPSRVREYEPPRNFRGRAPSYFRSFLCHLHATHRLTNPLGQKEVMLSEDNTTRALDRGEFLKRAGAGAPVASIPFWAQPGAWAGITKTSARKPLRIGNLLPLSGPNSSPSIDI